MQQRGDDAMALCQHIEKIVVEPTTADSPCKQKDTKLFDDRNVRTLDFLEIKQAPYRLLKNGQD